MFIYSDAINSKDYLSKKSSDQKGHDPKSDDEEHLNCGTPECCGQCETETSEKKS